MKGVCQSVASDLYEESASRSGPVGLRQLGQGLTGGLDIIPGTCKSCTEVATFHGLTWCCCEVSDGQSRHRHNCVQSRTELVPAQGQSGTKVALAHGPSMNDLALHSGVAGRHSTSIKLV